MTTIERVADELRSLHRFVHDRAAAPFDVEGGPARRSRQVLARYDGLLVEAGRMLEAPCPSGRLTDARPPVGGAGPGRTRPRHRPQRRHVGSLVMGEPHPMGVMADPLELVAALHSLGVIDRVPTGPETAEAERRAGGRALWRLECAQHLAGAVEIQVLMAAGAAADAGHGDIPITLTGREFYGGAGATDDAARIGVLLALTRRLADQVMLLTARLRRGDADDGLSPLVMPSLLVAEGLQGLLTAAANEAQGSKAHPRAGLPEVIGQLRGAADVLETMTPAMPPSP